MTQQSDDTSEKNTIAIENAGLVILWPFFSFYFQSLGLLKGNDFISIDASNRAAYLLHYLVTGDQHAHEQDMTLNKLLCGITNNTPLQPISVLSEKEIQLSNELLHTAITRWDVIKNTSVEGLRASFLMRNGKLEWQENKIILHVEAKPYDMLLDKIPWSISTIKLPWMQEPLYVTWR